ncbi:MAG: alpha/beta hydrolase [Candidatus Saccharibacteria bacterium]|nr:alpha/beta hydrolase [Candidatus Saccharibacteria bacterium]
MKTLDIDCLGYSVKTDVYEGSEGPIILSLIGRTSNRKKQAYVDFSERMVREQGAVSVVFDYSGHGDSPFDIADISPAQHFLEVINVFDWMKSEYPDRKVIVIGSSYGGFLATQLTKYRTFDTLVLRAPAIYRPSDFYTKQKDEDKDATMAFRQDADRLSTHPLLARASRFDGGVLLVVHENDENVPKETTNAYAKAFGADVITEHGFSHSLNDATPEQVAAYFEDIYGWLASH